MLHEPRQERREQEAADNLSRARDRRLGRQPIHPRRAAARSRRTSAAKYETYVPRLPLCKRRVRAAPAREMRANGS